MPAVPDIDTATVNALYAFLQNADPQPTLGNQAGAGAGGSASQAKRPVVASGGAPGGLELSNPAGSPYGRFGGPPYPDGADVPPWRYYSSYGTDYPYIISPPWSSVVAYDLNVGTIKWKVPLGDD